MFMFPWVYLVDSPNIKIYFIILNLESRHILRRSSLLEKMQETFGMYCYLCITL